MTALPHSASTTICHDPEEVFYVSAREVLKEEYWQGRSAVLSGGGTLEKIDDVRYISNFSSGKMASSLALALYLKGANVTLVSSRGYENLPKTIKTHVVSSSFEMYEALNDSLRVLKNENKKTFFFMVAAVSDYVPAVNEKGKLKKSILGSTWDLKLKQNMDILNSIDKENLVSIGFKAEMDETMALSNAQNMLEKKALDAVCLNVLNETNSFGSSDNEIELILKDRSFEFKGEKLELSIELLSRLQEEF